MMGEILMFRFAHQLTANYMESAGVVHKTKIQMGHV